MGNSITDVWINYCPEFFIGRPYLDRGISGQTTPQMLVRFRQDVVALQPEVVVILAGTNDIAGNTGPSTLEMIEDNLSSMAEIAKANGIKVALCSVLPVYDYPWRKGLEPAEKIVALNRWMKEYAERNGHTYVDYYTALADEKGGFIAAYTHDGVHPIKAGYEIMQSIIEKALAGILHQP
jgi:lysophospholipase L1-like esterase